MDPQVKSFIDAVIDQIQRHTDLTPGQDSSGAYYPVSEKTCFEVTIEEENTRIRVGVRTEDRWMSQSCEQAIIDSGDTMTEFLEDAMAEFDADPGGEVLHFHDSGRFFFSNYFHYERSEDLADPAFQNKVADHLRGYILAFGEHLTEED